MKSFNSVTTLVLAAVLIVAAAGCKKTPKSVTNIPRGASGTPTDEAGTRGPLTGSQTGRPVGSGNTLPNGANPNSTTLPGEGISSTPLTQDQIGNQTARPPEGTPEDATVLAAETVYFDFDRSTVKSSEVAKVQRVATYLKNQVKAMLRVEGNCDERGTEEYNRSLGERRALAVRELLIAAGIAPERVTTVTFGEDKPADPGHDETAWSKNRRADFVVLNPVTTGVQ